MKKAYVVIFMFFILCINVYAQPSGRGAGGQERGGGGMGKERAGGMNRGEVVSVNADEIVIKTSDSGTQTIKRTPELKVVREKRKALQDIVIGQNLLVIGQSESGQKYRAFMVRIVKDLPPQISQSQGRGGESRGPIQGKVISINPLTISTSAGDVAIELSDRINIFEETTASVEELKAGDKVMLIGPPGRTIMIVITEQLSQYSPQQKNTHSEGAFLKKEETAHTLPVPPAAKTSMFKKEIMDREKESPFGFKDPNMLRVDLFSWYGEFAEVMNDLGAYWMEPSAIWAFQWDLLQQKNRDGTYTSFDWERFDKLIRYAQSFNIHISAKIHSPPPEANFSKHEKIVPSLPVDMEAYRNFVKAVVERYDGDGKDDMPGLLYSVKRWKIEDEIMSPKFWKGSGGDYAVLLTNASESIKSADPSAVVICSMLRGYPGLGEDPRRHMLDFFQKLKDAGMTKIPCDIMDQHWMVTDPNMPKERQYLQIKELLDDLKKTASLYGFSLPPADALEIAGVIENEKSQAADLFKRYIYAVSLGIKKILWSGIKSVPDEQRGDVFTKNTIIYGDDTKKLAYYTYKKMVEKLNGSDWKSVETIKAEDDIYIFKFIKQNNPIWVLWNDSQDEKKVKLKVADNKVRIIITEALPKYEAGKFVTNYIDSFNRKTMPAENGEIEVVLHNTPIFVEIEK